MVLYKMVLITDEKYIPRLRKLIADNQLLAYIEGEICLSIQGISVYDGYNEIEAILLDNEKGYYLHQLIQNGLKVYARYMGQFVYIHTVDENDSEIEIALTNKKLNELGL